MSDEEERPTFTDKRRRFAEQGPMPEGIVLHKADGTEIPCEPSYRGLDSDGLWVWDVMTEVGPGDRLTVVQWPARTRIDFPNKHPDLVAKQTADLEEDNDG